MSVAIIFAIAPWPFLLIGGGCFLYCQWQSFSGGPKPSQTMRGGAFLLLMWPVLLIGAFAGETEANVVSSELLLGLFFLNVSIGAIFMWLKAWRSKKPLTRRQRIVSILAIPIGIIAAVQVCQRAARDAEDQREIDGIVTAMHIQRRGGFLSLPAYYIAIDGHDFAATSEVFKRIALNSHVRAMIGQGTKTIFSATATDH